MRKLFPRYLLASIAILISFSSSLVAQTPSRGSRTTPPVISQKIDGEQLFTLHGNVRADLVPSRDLGPVEDALPLRLYIVLQRSPVQQTALDYLLARQQQPTAAEYHQWLTPRQFGERFGASAQDIAKITEWLEAQGLHVNGVMNNASFIDFTATARDVREVFHTQLHYYSDRGGKFATAVSDPMVPAALAPVVSGIQGLNKIPPHSNHTPIKQASYDAATHRWHHVNSAQPDEAKPNYDVAAGEFYVTPQDFYTIYNVNPLFTAGTKGANSTVAVIEQSDIAYGTVNATTHVTTGGDVATFRRLFGVPGTLNMHVYHGYGTNTCNDPGIDPNGTGEEDEAALDAEWANALAPAADLVFMSCDQSPSQGIFTAELALVDNNLSDVMSLSYGQSELVATSSTYSFLDTLYSQAATQGQSFIVSSGDSGSDVKDINTKGTSTSGINVSAFGSSPNVTVAGGTDFVDLYDQLKGGSSQSTYWGATNSAYYADALGYVPETAWNDSCASSIEATYQGYSGAGLCALGPTVNPYIKGDVIGGSGGFSTHYAVPSYQSGITGYSGTRRAQPDISAFAANGFWGHALVSCDSHVAATACTSASTFGAGGGTSYVAPQMAGIGALLVSYTGTRQGLLNPALYALAKAQFTATATKASCYSNGQTSNTGITTTRPISTCTFNDVTSGNNSMPCAAGSTSCYVNSGAGYGMLSLTGATSLVVAYSSTPGYDEVTGIGTLNVNNLFVNWRKAFTSTTVLSTSAASITTAQSTNLTANVTGGLPPGSTGEAPALAGKVNFSAGAAALGSCTLSTGSSAPVCVLPVSGSALQIGSNSITATFAGSRTYPSSVSNTVTVSVSAAPAPVAGLSTNIAAFGSWAVGVQATGQAIYLGNTGNATLNIASFTISGTGASSFSIPVGYNACGATLAAGTHCIFWVGFKAAVAGALSANLSIVDDSANSPQTVALSGTGTAPAASLSATSLGFGSETTGVQTAAQSVTLTNTGNVYMGITSITLGGTAPLSFVITANACGTTLAAGASCTFSAAFKPAVTGALSATIAVADNAVNSPQNVTLTGTGASATGPILSVSPTSLTFGTENIGATSAGKVLTVKNTGTTNLLLQGSGSFSGTNADSFYQLNSCTSTLTPGASCYALISLAPQNTTGPLSATYIVNSTVGYLSIPLTGTGVATAAVTFSPSPLVSPTTLHGRWSVASILTVTNTGTSIATFSYIGIGGTNYTNFYELNSCGTALAAGSSCKVFVIFNPTAAGVTYSATLEFFDTAQNEYQGITLTGTGN
jgi:subtilase family serine protease